MTTKSENKDIEKEDALFDIPGWHKPIIDERLAAYKAKLNDVVDFDQACDHIEKEL